MVLAPPTLVPGGGTGRPKREVVPVRGGPATTSDPSTPPSASCYRPFRASPRPIVRTAPPKENLIEPARPAILALIPAHDEAPRIGRVVAAAREHLPVLVVDDGSSDATGPIAIDAGAEVLILSPNRGKGAALRAGFRAALERGAGAVVTLDGDGQHDPVEIPRFLAAYDDGRPDLVVGVRDFRAMPVVRRLANTLGRGALSWALATPIPDNQCGYRLVGRRLMAALEESREPGFEFEVEMIVACVRHGWPIAWVPISTIGADRPSHIRPWTHLTRFLRIVRNARRETRGIADA
ncbi:MAG TPA: glycosyltransferase family 2 protein [Candidatus Dormibacteraeota bacterium]|nr:glycosyltransferase family 2 protein [Candidatus Dormibacteraeota bacterium]